MFYRCPDCGRSITFIQQATVQNIIDNRGMFVFQKTIKVDKHLECEICGYYDKVKAFEIPEYKGDSGDC